MDRIKVEIPSSYLLQIAVCGDMGSGKLLKQLQLWAQKECEKNNLGDSMVRLMDKRLLEMQHSR